MAATTAVLVDPAILGMLLLGNVRVERSLNGSAGRGGEEGCEGSFIGGSLLAICGCEGIGSLDLCWFK